MKIKLIHFLVVFGISAMTCGNKTDMVTSTEEVVTKTEDMSDYQDTTTVFRDVVLTSQASFGGAQSNLKAVRKYELNLGVEIDDFIEFKRLLVDSISLPFSTLVVMGDKQSGLYVKETSKGVVLTAFRNIYNNDANSPRNVEVVTYEKSGQNIKEGAVVEYFKKGKPFYLEVDKIEIKKNIYAP